VCVCVCVCVCCEWTYFLHGIGEKSKEMLDNLEGILESQALFSGQDVPAFPFLGKGFHYLAKCFKNI